VRPTGSGVAKPIRLKAVQRFPRQRAELGLIASMYRFQRTLDRQACTG
jgi:hypothetical protein